MCLLQVKSFTPIRDQVETSCGFITRLYIVLYLRNRKHVLCFYGVIQTQEKVWENEKCCENMSRRRVFPQLSSYKCHQLSSLKNRRSFWRNLREQRRKRGEEHDEVTPEGVPFVQAVNSQTHPN